MRILLTGVTGYIGKRLLIQLLDAGHDVVCAVRDTHRFNTTKYKEAKGSIEVVEVDFLKDAVAGIIPENIDAAYYLIHSMATSQGDFTELEKRAAINFKSAMSCTTVRQVIYLTGISNEHKLSKHLQSRKDVEDILKCDQYALTSLRAGIIVGSGSASFEIIRDLVEKLPVMITPKWLNTKCQPIAIRNVIQFLTGVLGNDHTYNKDFDIAGNEVLTYKEMLLQYAAVRGLKRHIYTLPIMTPRLSSFWLYFITSTSYPLARHLVDSMKIDVVARKNDLAEKLGMTLLSYKQAIQAAFDKIKQNDVLSSWYDSFNERTYNRNVWQYIEVPEKGCFKDYKRRQVANEAITVDRIFGIGGDSGWYYANFLWTVRGYIDKIMGGVGSNRGRRDISHLEPGDSVDFWRVLYADTEEKRLLLFAEMNMPGEAWLEFKIKDGLLHQTATYRPLGVSGRLYWYAMWPFHYFIFNGMINKLVENDG